MSTATLSAHCKGYKCSEEAIRAIATPEATRTWHPISHGLLVDTVANGLQARGLNITTREYALARDGAQMFSVFNLASIRPGSDFTLALGLRNSMDKSLPAGLCVGSRVFVCDNLAFSAEIVLSHKHTSNIELRLASMVQNALDRVQNAEVKQAQQFAYWKSLEVSDGQASDSIIRMAKDKRIPIASIVGIREEFLTPRFKEFEGRTAWSLYNAATTVLRHDRREIDPIANADRLLGIHESIAAEYALAN